MNPQISADIDECKTDATACLDHPDSYCVNRVGDYTCQCNTGYKQVGNVTHWICQGKYSKRGV